MIEIIKMVPIHGDALIRLSLVGSTMSACYFLLIWHDSVVMILPPWQTIHEDKWDSTIDGLCNHVIMIKNVVRWHEGPVFNNVAPVLVEFKEEKDRWSIVIIIIIIVASDSLYLLSYLSPGTMWTQTAKRVWWRREWCYSPQDHDNDSL